ncbi:ATP-dependent metallopeptidase FtsH/Yme1/Tma family protein, partial [Campylobacter lari]
LRSGRFDKKVFLELPNLEDRKKILFVHLRDKNHELDVDGIARICVGFSGATLASLVNEAAIHALKQGRDKIQQEDVLAIKDKVFSGKKMYSYTDL